MRLSRTVNALIAAAGLAYGQDAARVEFDAASLKPSGPQSVRMENSDPVMYSYSGATLWDLLFKAWKLADYDKQISGPAWLREDSFDLIAHFPQGTTGEDFRTMLQKLLVERFRLLVHTETHDLPVYALLIGKNGPKLRETTPASSERKGDDCFPRLREGKPDIAVGNMADGRRCLAAQQETIATLLDMLRTAVDRPLVDRTGLTGRYDFQLEFSRELSDEPFAPEAPDIFTAIQQLGLRLQSSREPYKVLVVDHAERVPFAN